VEGERVDEEDGSFVGGWEGSRVFVACGCSLFFFFFELLVLEFETGILML
jgi:hypothetical protein